MRACRSHPRQCVAHGTLLPVSNHNYKHTHGFPGALTLHLRCLLHTSPPRTGAILEHRCKPHLRVLAAAVECTSIISEGWPLLAALTATAAGALVSCARSPSASVKGNSISCFMVSPRRAGTSAPLIWVISLLRWRKAGHSGAKPCLHPLWQCWQQLFCPSIA